MDSFHRLSHLTQPTVQDLPELKHQPPNIKTRYAIKSEGDAFVTASNQETQTKIWFQSPPLTAHTIRMIRGIKLFAEFHDQAFVSELDKGNWTWVELVILDNEKAMSPKKDRNGQELVVMSHPNKINSKEYEWLQGETFDAKCSFLKSLEAGNVIAVRLCARFANWQIYAKNGHLVVDIGDDNNPVPITPILIKSNDPIPPRRNVETWYKEAQKCTKTGLELSLFIRAMNTFQLLPPEDQLSYYRIAGIHGYPYNVPWNMGEGPIPIPTDGEHVDPIPGKNQDGYYCQHNSYLFPTWHRAYMMLFERRVSDLMMEEAVTREKETEEWVLAAKRWRLPYWDWAAAEPHLPDLARDEKIFVITSWDGQAQQPPMEELKNPMYRFQMPEAMGSRTYGDYRIRNKKGAENPWEICRGTSRHCIKSDDPEGPWVTGYSDDMKVKAALEGTHEGLSNRTLKDSVFRLLTHEYNTKYVHFASTKYDKNLESLEKAPKIKAKEYLNLEHIHNNVHNFIGGNNQISDLGHMSSVEVAGFDPIFWLHHCNIDRLLHLWQCSNPGNWFHQKETGEQLVDDGPQKDLIPFHSSSEVNEFYNSNMVRHIDALNYTYDYIDEITDDFGDMIPEKSHEYINKLYGPAKEAYQYSKKELDPIINVVYNRYALGGQSYTLLFFLGKNVVGSVFTFSTVLDQGAITCKNCDKQQRDGVLSRAQVPITTVVPIDKRRFGDDQSKAIANTMDYLNKNLQWKAVRGNNSDVIDRKYLTDRGLSITLSIGVNQLQNGLGRKSLFKYGDYEDQKEFNWDGAYMSD